MSALTLCHVLLLHYERQHIPSSVPVIHFHPCDRVDVQVGVVADVGDVQLWNTEGPEMELRQGGVVDNVDEGNLQEGENGR
ncbi:hypothetical protein SESBI_08443 [Sesbania bispinosa]|nr:hypothetical protein SESBI_08443 [Sesbania bispinosa]